MCLLTSTGELTGNTHSPESCIFFYSRVKAPSLHGLIILQYILISPVELLDLLISKYKDQDDGVASCVLCCCRSGFPGAQPVSMDQQNIAFLKRNPYKVSWKADGTRWVCCPGIPLFLCQTISQRF